MSADLKARAEWALRNLLTSEGRHQFRAEHHGRPVPRSVAMVLATAPRGYTYDSVDDMAVMVQLHRFEIENALRSAPAMLAPGAPVPRIVTTLLLDGATGATALTDLEEKHPQHVNGDASELTQDVLVGLLGYLEAHGKPVGSWSKLVRFVRENIVAISHSFPEDAEAVYEEIVKVA